jgi:hypothetical protein
MAHRSHISAAFEPERLEQAGCPKELELAGLVARLITLVDAARRSYETAVENDRPDLAELVSALTIAVAHERLAADLYAQHVVTHRCLGGTGRA